MTFDDADKAVRKLARIEGRGFYVKVHPYPVTGISEGESAHTVLVQAAETMSAEILDRALALAKAERKAAAEHIKEACERTIRIANGSDEP